MRRSSSQRAGGDQSQLRRSMLFVLLVTIKCRAIQQQITIRFIPPAIVRRNWRRTQQPAALAHGVLFLSRLANTHTQLLSYTRSTWKKRWVLTFCLLAGRSNKFFGFLVPWDFFLSLYKEKRLPAMSNVAFGFESLSVWLLESLVMQTTLFLKPRGRN